MTRLPDSSRAVRRAVALLNGSAPFPPVFGSRQQLRRIVKVAHLLIAPVCVSGLLCTALEHDRVRRHVFRVRVCLLLVVDYSAVNDYFLT